MRLFLIRHGETDANKKELLQGWLDYDLNENGRFQAKRLAERLKSEKIDAFYSSDLKRAKRTALEVMKYHSATLNLTPLIRERNFGFFEGMEISKFHKIIDEWDLPFYKFRPPKGESYEDMLKRAKKFYDYLFRKHKNQTIAVFSHGGFNRVMLSHILSTTFEEVYMLPQDNTCINLIEINGSKPEIIVINDIRHIR